MTNSIPASQLVRVTPSVLSAGGDALDLNSVFLSQDAAVPVGQVLAFPTSQSVTDYFGAGSPEALLAPIYFAGFEGASILPSKLYFARWNASAVAAYLRSGSLVSLTLAQLQAFSGTLIVPINGETVTSSTINLSSATSFTNAASLITAGIQVVGGIFSGTASQSTTNLTVTAVASGALHVGDSVLLASSTSTTIVSQTSGTPGGIGVYVVSTSATQASTTATVTSTAAAVYDSQRHAFVLTSPTTGVNSTIGYATGTLAANIKFTAATGAIISNGSAIAVATTVMDGITQITQDWALFMTVWEPDLAGKEAFAAWVATTISRYGYVAWDTDVSPTLTAPATGSFAQLTINDNGVIPVWGPADKAAFICGATAAINFNETQGRITYAYKAQSGLTADVTDATIAANLLSNGYNFYGNYSTANQQFTFLQNGQCSGDWNWIDSFVDQIKLNSDLQLAFMDLFASVKSVPYNTRGYNLLRAAASDPINAALNFGSIQPGVELSARQIAEIDTAAGQTGVGRAVITTGYYLQIKPAVASIRVDRGSPPMTLWFSDGGSIQAIDLASIDVQ
jgi:hypothetical protein